MAEQSSWLPLPSCSPPSFPFPINLLLVNSGGDSLLWLTSWPLGVLRNQLAHWWTKPRGHNWDSWNGLTRMPLLGKEQETLFDLSPLSSLVLLLNPSYPTVFFLSPGFGLRNLVKESQPELRVWGRSPLVLTESSNSGSGLFWILVGVSSSPSFLEAQGKVL